MDTETQHLIETYQPSDESINRFRDSHVIILVGITAAGKDTIIRDIVQRDSDFARVVTSTTRAPRENNGIMEQHGVEYYFLTPEDARQKIADKEYAEVANVHGRINGSLVAEFERITSEDRIALMDIDYQGVLRFLDFGMSNLTVYFVTPPSFEVWLARLAKRQGGNLQETAELIARFESAQKELTQALNDPRFVPVMNEVSANTADEIIQFAKSGVAPSQESIKSAHGVIRELRDSITDYIDQLKSDV